MLFLLPVLQLRQLTDGLVLPAVHVQHVTDADHGQAADDEEDAQPLEPLESTAQGHSREDTGADDDGTLRR